MHVLRRLLRRGGIDLARHRPHLDADWRRARLLERADVDLVLDVGGNVGAYARALREAGYAGRIVSFEPVAPAFSELERAAADDPSWDVRNVAVGAEAGRATINVGGSTTTSSLLAARAELQTSDDWRVAATQEVDVVRLDDVAPAFERGFLKLDTQGTELDVLAGAPETVARVEAIEVELAFQPFYEEQPSYLELLRELDALGFVPFSFEAGYVDPATGAVSYADALYRRTSR